jgi:hypothetical protein
MLKTTFWQKAAASLQPSIRARHIADIERAENFEIALEGAVRIFARAREIFARMYPRHPLHGLR